MSSILEPLTDEELTRGNAANLIGGIEQSLNFKHENPDKKNPGKVVAPSFDPSDYKQNYNELLPYDKMREMAYDHVRSKRSWLSQYKLILTK